MIKSVCIEYLSAHTVLIAAVGHLVPTKRISLTRNRQYGLFLGSYYTTLPEVGENLSP